MNWHNRDEVLLYQKRYRESHKEELKAKGLIYRQNNREYLRQLGLKNYNKKRYLINCACGKYIVKAHIKRHERTKFHFKHLTEEIEDSPDKSKF